MGWVVTVLVGLEAGDTVINVGAIVAVHKVIFGKYYNPSSVAVSEMTHQPELTTNASVASTSSHDGSLVQGSRVNLAHSRKVNLDRTGVLLLALCCYWLLSGSARPRCKSFGCTVDDLAILLHETLDEPVLLALAACSSVDAGLAQVVITIVADTAVEVVGI